MFQVSKRRLAPLTERAAEGCGSSRESKCSAAPTINMQRVNNRIFAHISAADVLSIEDQDGCCQRSENVSAAYACVVIEATPGNRGLEHIAPAIHVGGEEIWSQAFEEFDSADDVEREIESQRRHCCRHRRLKQNGKEHRDSGHDEQRPGPRKTRVSKTPKRFVAQDLAGFINEIEWAGIEFEIAPADKEQPDQQIESDKEDHQKVSVESNNQKF